MEQSDESSALGEFFRVNDISDAYRNEKFEEVFPEYAQLRSYVTAG